MQDLTSKMDEEEHLRKILLTIGYLSEHGEVPVHVFGPLFDEIRGELVAEQLHQKWLTDPNFAKIAPKIVHLLSDDITISTKVLSLALRDFERRLEIRSENPRMFRNFIRTLVELYVVYREIDNCLSVCLIEPLFDCLRILVNDDPDDNDLNCAAWIFINAGRMLFQLKPVECDSTIMRCRKWLCSNELSLDQATKYLIMSYSWNTDLFPDCLRSYYEEEKNRKILTSNLEEPSIRTLFSRYDGQQRLDSEESERLSNSETNEEKMPSDDRRNNVKLDENESFV